MDKKITHEVAARIHRLRLDEGMDQTEFGLCLDKDNTVISRWEAGKNLINTETVMLICKKFGISADWLLFGE